MIQLAIYTLAALAVLMMIGAVYTFFEKHSTDE